MSFGAFSAQESGPIPRQPAGSRSEAGTQRLDSTSIAYYQVTVAPSAGYTSTSMHCHSAYVVPARDPRLTVRSSIDNYASNLGSASASSPELSVANDEFHFVNDIGPVDGHHREHSVAANRVRYTDPTGHLPGTMRRIRNQPADHLQWMTSHSQAQRFHPRAPRIRRHDSRGASGIRDQRAVACIEPRTSPA